MVKFEDIARLSEKIVREYQPERVILFGSHAYGTPRPDSDVDLLVVLRFEGRSFWKSLEILNHVAPSFAVDLLARRPDDTARRYSEGDPLIREALDRGKVLYEQHLKEWTEKAEGDFSTASRELQAATAPNYDAVCFHAQQCVEKLIRALLIHLGVTPPRTHDLPSLDALLAPACSGWSWPVEDLRFLTRASVDFRYPGEQAGHAEARKAFEIASQMRNKFALVWASR